MAMSKEELIDELIRAKVNEARAKKGYEVKGDGTSKEYSSLSNKNFK
jgi:transposase